MRKITRLQEELIDFQKDIINNPQVNVSVCQKFMNIRSLVDDIEDALR